MAAFSLAMFFAASPQAHASLVLVDSRAALNGSDYIDWAQIGPDYTEVNSPYTATSNLGQPVVASLSSGAFMKLTQGLTFNGNFAPGDAILWNEFNGTVTINFGVDVSRAGAQIMADYYGAFVAQITAFDSLNSPLGSFTVNGDSNGSNDNSAVFIGVADTSAIIRQIQFSLTSAEANLPSFSINRVDFAAPAAEVVPEPGTWAAAALLLGGAGFSRWRKRAKVA